MFGKINLFFCLLSSIFTPLIHSEEGNRSEVFSENNQSFDKKTAFVIPVRDQIGPPILNILRRGLKQSHRY